MKQKVLVIDDEKVYQVILKDVLKNDFDVICKSDGAEALHWLKEDLPDIIICDIQMNNLDGYAFLDEIRKEGAFTEHIPVVMLSGADDSKERIKCYNKKAQDFLAKPFNADELMALIKKNLAPIHYKITEVPEGEVKKATILFIDDEKMTRILLENLIKKHKWDKLQVETAGKSDGIEALLWLEVNHPDLIICDVNMEGMGGYDFLEKLRQRGYSKHTPVLMLSGVESPKDRIKCYKNGAQDFLAKPFNSEELLALIDKNLKPVHFAKTW